MGWIGNARKIKFNGFIHYLRTAWNIVDVMVHRATYNQINGMPCGPELHHHSAVERTAPSGRLKSLRTLFRLKIPLALEAPSPDLNSRQTMDSKVSSLQMFWKWTTSKHLAPLKSQPSPFSKCKRMSHTLNCLQLLQGVIWSQIITVTERYFRLPSGKDDFCLGRFSFVQLMKTLSIPSNWAKSLDTTAAYDSIWLQGILGNSLRKRIFHITVSSVCATCQVSKFSDKMLVVWWRHNGVFYRRAHCPFCKYPSGGKYPTCSAFSDNVFLPSSKMVKK